MRSSRQIDAQGRVTLLAARYVQRVGNVGITIGILFSICAVVRLVTLPPDQQDLIPIGVIVIGFGFAFAFLSRVVSRAFVRPTVVSFLEKHGNEISSSVRQEFEGLNLLPAEFFSDLATSPSSSNRTTGAIHPVDSLQQPDGVIEAVFRQHDQTFRVLFGAAMCQPTGDAAEPWRVVLAARRKDSSEVSYDTLDDLIQASPYLRFRFDNADFFREPDEWSRGDSYNVAGALADISIGFFLHDSAATVELLWVVGTGMSLGVLPIRLDEPSSRKT